MLKIKTKSITRSDWPRVPKRSFVWQNLNTPTLKGAAALLRLDAVTTPLVTTSCGTTVTLVDAGYYWMQIAPVNAHWWLTYMLDPQGRIYQYYFDITLENRINGCRSAFDDLFLDVVALPDGKCELLDFSELKDALSQEIITQAQYEMALQQSDSLIRALPERIHQLNAFCNELFHRLKTQMDSDLL